MKKIFLSIFAAFLALPCAMAANMKMVTYFPVPYAAYNDVSVTGAMDLGLMNTCSLDAGGKLDVLKGTSGRTLDTGTLILREGGLNLDSSKSASQVKGLSFKAGDGGASAQSVLEFKHDLEVASLPLMQSTEATNKAYLSSLTLFPAKITSGNAFPSCDVSQISWQKLDMGSGAESFLVCGTGKETTYPRPDDCGPCDSWNEKTGRCIKKACMIGQKLNTATCQCENDEDTKKYTCWKNFSGHRTGACGANVWTLVYYSTDMVCGGESAHHSGTVSCKPGQECECEPGKQYLWYETWGCGSGAGTAKAWYCLTCQEVSSLSECPALNFPRPGDSNFGGSGGPVDFKPMDPDTGLVIDPIL